MASKDFLMKLYKDLHEFKKRSCVGVDPTRDWIISKEEDEALDILIDTISDCMDMGQSNKSMV